MVTSPDEPFDRIVSGLKATFVARVIHVTATGALMVLLARYLLDPDEYGTLFLAVAIFGIAMMFSDLGIAKSAARYLTEYRESDHSQVPHIIRLSFIYRVVAIGVVGAVFVVFAGPMAHALGQPDLQPLLLLAPFYVSGHSLYTYSALVFQGFNRVTLSAGLRTIASGGRFVFVLVFVFVVGSALGALVGFIVGYALTAVVGLGVVYLRFYRRYEKAPEAESGLGTRILKYSVPIAASRGGFVLDSRIDMVLVGYFINPVAAGYYYIGKQIVDFIQTPASSLGVAVSPTYGDQKAANQVEHASRLYQTTLRNTLLLYVPAGAGLALVADPTIRYVFGTDYLGAVPVVQIFSAFVLLQSITFITSNALDFIGRARMRAYAKGSTSVANLLLNLALIPTFGVVGAAVATVVTHAVYVVVNLYVIHQEFVLDLASLGRDLAGICAITVVMSVSVLLLAGHISGIGSLLAVIAVAVAIWAVLATVSGLLDVKLVATVLS